MGGLWVVLHTLVADILKKFNFKGDIMKYDFTSIIDRRGKDAIAVDRLPEIAEENNIEVRDGFDPIPMWVADMNFKVLPDITDAIIERAKHPLYGYFGIRDEYYESIINWHKNRNNVSIKKEYIGYENGVLGGVSSTLHAFCSQGDSVLIHAPTYTGFTRVLKDNGYNIVHSYLKKDAKGVWRMDFADMEEKILENRIHVAIFCSPHNPTGRVWERWELEKIMELYTKYDITVISDEIWSDIILYSNKHIPTQSVSEDAKSRTVALYAPSKTFNLAGLVGSYHIIYNKKLRERVEKESILGHYNSMNVLSMHALIGAYTKGSEWTDELRSVIGDNVDYAYNYITQNFDGIKVSKPQGTYMLFIDCEEWCKKHNKTLEELLKMGYEVGVFWQNGKPFNGEWFIRMNLASPKSKIKEAFERLARIIN